MKNVCVITGAGSGMGLATAKIMGGDHLLIIAGRTVDKLEKAVVELQEQGIEVIAYPCDVSKKDSVVNLAKYAKSLGKVKTVIHSAGVSPSMGHIEDIIRINALGTIYVHEAFYSVMEEESCLIDVASMAGHMIPNLMIPRKTYKKSRLNQEYFVKKNDKTM